MLDGAHPWRLWLAQHQLRRRLERDRFRASAAAFADRYQAMSQGDLGPWVTPLWERFNEKLERALLPTPPERFLRESVIRQSMFVDVRGEWLESQLGLVSSVFGDRLPELAAETPVGDPPLCDAALMTSHNTVHHLAHVASFLSDPGEKRSLEGTSSVMEWGGGYGNFCRVLTAACGSIERYCIVDTPLFCALQWLYLSVTLGKDRVRVWDGDSPVGPGITIVPVTLAPKLEESFDLFVSTWALSECPPEVQDFAAVERSWFGAERLLLAFQASNQDLPDAGRLGDLAEGAGCTIEPVRVIDDNFYAFR